MDMYQFLADQQIEYTRYDHPPVFTCDEATRLCPEMPKYAAKTKNLFLRDKKGARHFLVTVEEQKRVDMKALGAVLGVNKLSFASPKRLEKYLGLTPGAVTLLGVLNDTAHEVTVIVDAEVWNARAIRCHPLVNTSTLIIAKEHIARFLDATGHPAQVIDVPARGE